MDVIVSLLLLLLLLLLLFLIPGTQGRMVGGVKAYHYSNLD